MLLGLQRGEEGRRPRGWLGPTSLLPARWPGSPRKDSSLAEQSCTSSCVPHVVSMEAWGTPPNWLVPKIHLPSAVPSLPLLPPLSHPSALRSRGNLIIKPQTTLACLFKLIARVAHSPRPSKNFQQDGQGGRGWWGPGWGEQRRDRSMNWECLQRKIFIRSDPGEAGVGACVHVCAYVYICIYTHAHLVTPRYRSWELVNKSRFTGHIPKTLVYQKLCQAHLHPFDHRSLSQSL